MVVELKQWTDATAFEDDPDLVLVDAYGREPHLPPGAQVRRYCEYLLDFTKALSGQLDPVNGVAYLHNAHRPPAG